MTVTRITMLQVFWLSVLVPIGYFLPFVGMVTGTGLQEGATLATFLMGVPGILIIGVVISLARKFPLADFDLIAERTVGKWGAKVALAAFAAYYLIFSVITFRIGVQLVTILLPETPLIVLLGFLVFVSLVAVNSGIEVIARLAELLGPAVVGLLILGMLVLAPNFDYVQLLPLVTVPRGIATEALWHSLAFGEWAIWLFLLPYIDKPSQISQPLLKSWAWYVGLNLGLVVSLLGVFGAPQAAGLSYPVFSLFREVSIGGFLERLEVVFLSVWLVLFFLRGAVFTFVGMHAIKRLFGLRHIGPVLPSVGLFFAVTALAFFHDTVDVRELVIQLSPAAFFAPIAVGIPVLLLIVDWLRGMWGSTDETLPDACSEGS